MRKRYQYTNNKDLSSTKLKKIQWKDYLDILRPLSLTCSVMATLITTAVVDYQAFFTLRFGFALIMAISVQLAANLTNTFFDYKNGIDIVDERQKEYRLDRGLANGIISENILIILMVVFYSIAILCIIPFIISTSNNRLLIIFSVGILLAFFYTANPLGFGGLKYKALGDITIFTCFGPLLMQCISIMLTDSIRDELYIFSVPIGLLTEAILHANNSRDIATDTKAGAITLAAILGFEKSYYFYYCLFIGAYISAIIIALYSNWGCLLTLFTIPIANNLLRTFKSKNMDTLPQMTSKLHLPFGILFFIGIMISQRGILYTLHLIN